MIRLTPERDDQGGRSNWDDDRRRVLGRSHECDVAFTARGVSKRHCVIERRPEGYFVTDLDSSNGTQVNGRRIETTEQLHDGDRLGLGRYTLVVEVTGYEPTSAGRFTIDDGGAQRTTITPLLRLGRRAGSDVVVSDSGVSRDHATLTHADKGYVLRDEGSKNGTFVNGRRVVTRLLVDNDEVTLGGPPGDRVLIRVTHAEGGALRIVVERSRTTVAMADTTAKHVVMGAPGEATSEYRLPDLGERTVLRGVEATGAFKLPVGATAETDDSSAELSRVIRSLEKEKARYRGGKWVPTSDLLPNRALRAGNTVVLGLVALVSVGVAATGRVALVNPGPVAGVHRGDAYVAQAGDAAGSCRPCHEAPFFGVRNSACSACHAQAEIFPPHDSGTILAAHQEPLRCAGCHNEHKGDAKRQRHAALVEGAATRALPHPDPALPVDSQVCIGCHANAHEKAGESRETPGVAFLNVFYSSAWVHTLHVKKPNCAACHQSAEDRATGRVTTGCDGCHGGAKAEVAQSDCLSCHHMHKKGTIVLKREVPPRRI